MNEKAIELAVRKLKGELTDIQLHYWLSQYHLQLEEVQQAMVKLQSDRAMNNHVVTLIIIAVSIGVLVWLGS